MSIYAEEKLICQARQLAADYRRTMGKPLPGVGNEVATHDAIRLLGLMPVNRSTGGYDAVDPRREDKRIQIKSRTIFDESVGSQRIGQIKVDQEWDSVVLVLMDEDYDPFEIYEAERDDLMEYVGKSSGSRAKRGILSVSRFRIIARLAWTRDDGLESEVWDNQAET